MGGYSIGVECSIGVSYRSMLLECSIGVFYIGVFYWGIFYRSMLYAIGVFYWGMLLEYSIGVFSIGVCYLGMGVWGNGVPPCQHLLSVILYNECHDSRKSYNGI